MYFLRNIKVTLWSELGHIMVIQRVRHPIQGILLASFKVIEGQNYLSLSWSLFKIPFIFINQQTRAILISIIFQNSL